MKQKVIKVTFKKRPRSKGLAGIGEGFWIDAKIKGKKFATICGKSAWHKGYPISIQIAVVRGDTWGWVFPKIRNILTEDQAKEFIQGTINDFVTKYELHFFED